MNKRLNKGLIATRKGAEDLTSKALFAIFIVVFVMFVIFTVLRSRGSSTLLQAQSQYYVLANSFMLAMLGSPCFSVGDYDVDEWQITTSAFLDEQKLNYYNNGNEDLPCVKNYNFFYSLTIVDSTNGKRWRIGLKEEPEFAERKLTLSMPVSIRYNSTIPKINSGYGAVTVYLGNIPSFYSAIKQACTTHEEIRMELQSDYSIEYNSTLHIFRVGNHSFYPNLGCRVEDFKLEKGRFFVIIKYTLPGEYVKILI